MQLFLNFFLLLSSPVLLLLFFFSSPWSWSSSFLLLFSFSHFFYVLALFLTYQLDTNGYGWKWVDGPTHWIMSNIYVILIGYKMGNPLMGMGIHVYLFFFSRALNGSDDHCRTPTKLWQSLSDFGKALATTVGLRRSSNDLQSRISHLPHAYFL